mmetsp:Transcript_38856/g.90373  ORF Transcript_38856/g.90373 Transcript_38856/m.90373 type:complete len:210 (+) Transcript_38856:448-1077(+)
MGALLCPKPPPGPGLHSPRRPLGAPLPRRHLQIRLRQPPLPPLLRLLLPPLPELRGPGTQRGIPSGHGPPRTMRLRSLPPPIPRNRRLFHGAPPFRPPRPVQIHLGARLRETLRAVQRRPRMSLHGGGADRPRPLLYDPGVFQLERPASPRRPTRGGGARCRRQRSAVARPRRGDLPGRRRVGRGRLRSPGSDANQRGRPPWSRRRTPL